MKLMVPSRSDAHFRKPTNPSGPIVELQRLGRKLERERNSRIEAEKLLEGKSLELYNSNFSLKKLNEDLENKVDERTRALRESMKKIEIQQQEAEFSSRHDALTGLPNRRFLAEHLLDAQENWQRAAVLYIDLDRFKQINDTLGHAAGDELLRVVAQRLYDYAPDDAFIARIGGDEFVILLPRETSRSQATDLGLEIVRRLPEPIAFEGNTLRFGTSVGVSRRHKRQTSPDDMLIEADLALYRAKNAGRGCSILFTDQLRAESVFRKRLSDDLVTALETDQIQPAYQPRVSSETGQIVCVEALARWHHPEMGFLLPETFLSVAEDIGQLAEIDKKIMEIALKQLAQWDRDGLHIPRVTVNVSSRRIMHRDLLEQLDQLDIPRGRLSFELLESVFFDTADQETLDRLDDLRERGIGIEIDDFGSGHASITGLLAVRPDTLKIDRALVCDAIGDTARIELLAAVVTIGKSLHLQVVAEGAETDAHVELCRRLGCHQIQGFAISKPLPSGDLFEFATKLKN